MLERLRRLLGNAEVTDSPTASASSKVWPEEALEEFPYSLQGLRIGAGRQQVISAAPGPLRQPTKVCWSWGEHGMNSVLFDGDRVCEIWATSLEKDGKTILSQGDPVEALAVLGESSRSFGFSTSTERHVLYDMPPFLLDVAVTTEAAEGSPEHEMLFDSKQVVDRVFHIHLKLEA